jgi:N utilization substance protein B
MRALYQMDLSGCGPRRAVEYAIGDSPDLPLSPHAKEYAESLVMGAWAHREAIDSEIASLARDWSVGRMSPTDRNVMRVAVYEMLYVDGVPMATSIDEAVEIAKIYGSADSPRFINGILGGLAEKLRATRGRSGAEESQEDTGSEPRD